MLVTWAASTTDINGVVARAGAAGVDVSGPREGSRIRPDGVTLHWRTAAIGGGLAEGHVDPMPFFIQWADSVHPAADAPFGCRLVSLDIQHPDPAKVRETFARLGISVSPASAAHAALRAILDTPRGRVTLA